MLFLKQLTVGPLCQWNNELGESSVGKWRSGIEKEWERSDNMEENIYEDKVFFIPIEGA